MEKSTIFGQNLQFGTNTKKGWYWYPLDRGKVVPVPIKVVPVSIKVVPVPIHHKRVGTGTNASSSLYFCTLALLSPKFVHR